MTAVEPLGSAWHLITVHCEDVPALFCTFSSCLLLLLITGNLRLMWVQINRPTCESKMERL